MIKVRISYEKPEELQRILKRLEPEIKRYKIATSQKGSRFKKAYVDMKE